MLLFNSLNGFLDTLILEDLGIWFPVHGSFHQEGKDHRYSKESHSREVHVDEGLV